MTSVGVLISGGGRTLQNLIDQQDELGISIKLVIVSRAGIAGIRRACDAGIPHRIMERWRRSSRSQYTSTVFDVLREASVDLVCMGGFLEHLAPIPSDFRGRVLNIHPSLIPSFCGRGMYGGRVHQAVLDRGVKVTGCTVHYVDDELDHGPIIVQRSVEVLESDTPETLGERVFEAECEAYPVAIRLAVESAAGLPKSLKEQ